MTASSSSIWAASALIGDRWADSVAVDVDIEGNIASIRTGVDAGDAARVDVLLPAIPNVHSHAHQRAMAGLGERAGRSGDAAADSFWTWRKVMYHYLERIRPDDLEAIAAQLYLEMLRAGYGAVGEFQYLHHDPDGQRYDNPAEMSLACLAAARRVGIGFTALPVLYRYGGFGSTEPLDGQKRFINDRDGFSDIVERLRADCAGDANAAVGIAPHSLRAVDEALLRDTIGGLGELAAIHIHIAEQTAEVDACLEWSGQRPVAWLLDRFDLDPGWCLVHATHLDADETRRMASSGCIAGLCPTTEANLGDGLFNALDYVAAGGRWAIGSDSHISIDPVEEFRWFEYGQRLLLRQRNLLTDADCPSTGRHLLDSALAGGEFACGRRIGRLEPGYRADLIALDTDHPRLYGRHQDALLDSWIFSGNDNLVRDVWIGGQQVIDGGHHADEDRIADAYRRTIDRLAAD